ncbi:MAG: M20/M25/M40 family metallo-hydrolase [Candidatus Micrarchaeota archaeon]|nr:M20/M25/M40 family metallo-hydrolase [Candidatus Micrarchaeota archaeon]
MHGIEWELRFLKEMVAMPTVAGDDDAYRRMEKFLVSACRRLGGKVKVIDPMRDGKSKVPKPNIIADFDYGKDKTVVLNCHYDVVPSGDGWRSNPFRMLTKSGKVYGRGTCDDKGPLALSVGLVREMNSAKRRNYNIRLMLTCDEEVGSELGLKYVIGRTRVKDIDLAIVMDAHRVPIAGCSGVVQGRFMIKGLQWHAGEDWRGRNAILDGMRFIGAMQGFKRIRARHLSRLELSETDAPYRKVFGRFNITKVKSGHAPNVMPGEFEATFDMRLIPEEDPDAAIGELKRYVKKVENRTGIKVPFEITMKSSGYSTDLKNGLVRKFIKADNASKAYGTWGGLDGRFFAEKRIPTIAYGIPLGNSTDHAANEYVVLKDMQKAKETLVRFAMG